MAEPIVPLAIALLNFFYSLTNAKRNHNVLAYRENPDGKTESTSAFLAAWTEACNSIKHVTIYVPQGRFLLGSVAFCCQCKNDIKLHLEGTLVDPSSDWRNPSTAEAWLLFENVHGVRVHWCMLDGQGSGLWSCNRSRSDCPYGAMVRAIKDKLFL